MDWRQDLRLFLQFVQAFSFVFTGFVAWKIYTQQKTDAAEQRTRDARARLTEAYYRLDNDILASQERTEATRELMFARYTSHQVKRIMYMYMIFDVLHLHWRFYRDYSFPEWDFQDAINLLLGRIVNTIRNAAQRDDYFLLDDFETTFPDCPDEFKRIVRECINLYSAKGQ